MEGPDQILPAASLTMTDPEGAVKFRNEETLREAPPMSVPTMLKATADKYPDKTALAVKRSDEWVKWTYKQGSDSIGKKFCNHFLKFLVILGSLNLKPKITQVIFFLSKTRAKPFSIESLPSTSRTRESPPRPS